MKRFCGVCHIRILFFNRHQKENLCHQRITVDVIEVWTSFFINLHQCNRQKLNVKEDKVPPYQNSRDVTCFGQRNEIASPETNTGLYTSHQPVIIIRYWNKFKKSHKKLEHVVILLKKQQKYFLVSVTFFGQRRDKVSVLEQLHLN